ncbi:hypothetical protein [Isoptericola sp. NPDC057559]|uniref:hypothetical protein n=1 Tax=Isoptericola sp. NPDC057559 TaxID=3346168 RepID=UPI00367DA46B
MATLHDRVPVPAFHGLAGVATRDVSPPVGIRARNWGPADWDAAEGQHRSMALTAVALAGADGDPVVTMTVDGTWWRRVDDEAGVRHRVLEALGLPAERLLISLSHTHAGPVLCAGDADLPGGDLVPGYLDALAAAAVDAGREALGALRPAVLEWTTGRCALAADRELLVETPDEPRPVVGWNPEVPADDTVLVGRLTAADGDGPGRPLATIVNYACHPTTLSWQNRLVSPDYVGAMRDLVQGATGAPVAFLQGASGELAPRQQYTGDLAVADRHGEALGHAVLAALAELPPPGTSWELTRVVESGAPLGVWEPAPSAGSTTLAVRQEDVELDLRPLPTIAELEQEWAGIDPGSREERLRRARNLRDGYVTGPTVRHPAWVWQVGDAILVAHPGEAYSRLQRTVREHAAGRPVVVANLTNGPGFVYLPTDVAYERGAYQAWQTPVAPGSLARLEAHAARLIDTLPGTPGEKEDQ